GVARRLNKLAKGHCRFLRRDQFLAGSVPQSLARPSPDHPFRGAAGLTRQAPDGSYAKDRRAKRSTPPASGRYPVAISQKVDAARIVTIVLPNGCQPWGTLPKLQGLAPMAITPHKPFRTFTGRSGRHICLLAPRAARERVLDHEYAGRNKGQDSSRGP